MSDTKRETPDRGSPALAAAISATLGVAGTASAQTSGGLETIIVTATRRAENLQNVPESISAFDTEAIEMRGLKQMDDYAKFVPGLSLGVREPGGTTIVFRGVASSGLQFGAVSSSALYLDEQPITQSGRNPDPRLIDIERLEALRGPQGTLYGASSQSGTLRVITNKPDPLGVRRLGRRPGLEHPGRRHGLRRERHGQRAAGRGPAGAAARRLHRRGRRVHRQRAERQPARADVPGEGTFDNADQVDEDVNSAQTSGARAALRWDVTDNVDVTLGALFQDLSTDGHGDVNLGVGDLNQVRFEDESLDDEWYQLALTLNASLSFGDLVLSASYFDRDFRYEADATDYEFNFDQTSSTAYPMRTMTAHPRSTTSAAIRAASRPTTSRRRSRRSRRGCSRRAIRRAAGPGWSGPSTARRRSTRSSTASSAATRIRRRSRISSTAVQLYDATLAPTDRWFLGRYDTELDQVAVFGELVFDLTENFTITAGARWFDYDRKFAQIRSSPRASADSPLDDNQATERGRHGRQAEPRPTASTRTASCTRPTRRASASAAATR